MLFVAFLGGCGLEPPLSFDRLIVDGMSFDTVYGDLAFQVEDEGEAGTVDTMDYTLAVEGTPLYDDVYTADSEVDAGLVLAPMSVALRDVFEVADLFHADDEIPFEITGHYTFQSTWMHLEYVLVQGGTMPAPRAPRFEPTLLSSANLSVDVVNDNVDDVEITLAGTTVEVDGQVLSAVDPAPFDVPGDGGTVTVDLRLDPVGSGWDGRAVTVHLRSEAVVETVFGPIPLTVDQATDLE